MKDLLIIIAIIIIISIVIFYFINKAINYFKNENSVLLDADVNKLIAENSIREPLEEALKPIIKQINKAALKGKTFYIVDDSYHYRYKDKFSREEIENFFKKYGYKVVFVYCMISDSSIEKITW